MARQLVLDTNALIAYERAAFDTSALDDDDLAIAALTVAEFRVGIELARTAARAAERARVLAVIIDARARLGDLPGVRALDPLSDNDG